MPVFAGRSQQPAKQRDYRRYRPEVREDFHECYAYCLLHELLAGGPDNFELDHFQPKSKPAGISDVNGFYNLYYACHVCNHYKGYSWPDQELLRRGYRFVDTCNEDSFTHFRTERTGEWTPIALAGQYTEARLRLNRLHLLRVRVLLNQIAELRGSRRLDWSSPIREQIAGILPNYVLSAGE